MTPIDSTVTVGLVATFSVTEEELAALNALACYNDSAFLKTFYQQMGRAYLEPHERGLLSLFHGIRQHAPGLLTSVKKARKLLQTGALNPNA